MENTSSHQNKDLMLFFFKESVITLALLAQLRYIANSFSREHEISFRQLILEIVKLLTHPWIFNMMSNVLLIVLPLYLAYLMFKKRAKKIRFVVLLIVCTIAIRITNYYFNVLELFNTN